MFTKRHLSTSVRLRRAAGIGLLAVVAATSFGGAPAGADGTAPDRRAGDGIGAAVGAEVARRDTARRVEEERVLATEAERARQEQARLVEAVGAFVTSRAGTVATLVDAAGTRLGRPYARGAAGPSAFDCSGFTRWAWQQVGVTLPHYTGAQWDLVERIDLAELQPGDLVFYWGGGGRGDPGHVGLYVGDGTIVHAPGSGRSVRYDRLDYWSGARVAAGRVP